MRMLAVSLAMLLGTLFTGAIAADTAEAEKMCSEWAKEDGVKADELEQYLADCVADQMAAAEENAPKD